MGLFDFLKKKEEPSEEQQSALLLAMPMYGNSDTFDMQKIADHLSTNWGTTVTEVSKETMTVDGETVAIMAITAQIPWGDIQGTAQYSYSWPTAEKDLEDHDSHAIVTLLSSNKSQLDRYVIFTKVLASLFATSNAIGVYQGSQSLLISKNQYLSSAEALKIDKTPIDLWIYIGLRKTEGGNNAYSYGLTGFDKLEMEFINCHLEIEDIHTFLGNICAYVINSNVTFRSGETLGYTEEQKITITQSKGLFVEGQTLKLEM